MNKTFAISLALAFAFSALAAYPDAPDSLLAQYYGELSATYNVMGQMRPSADWAQQALPLMRRYGSNEDFAVICGNTGIAYRRLGNNDSAAICYREGLSVAIEASDYDSQAFLANCLSVLYTEMGRYAESIDYADKAALAAIKAGDDVERLSAQANKGIALLRDKQVDKAVQTLTTTFAEADTTHSTPLKLKTINYLLSALTEAKRWKEVAEYLEKGEQLAAPLPPSSTASAGILEAKKPYRPSISLRSLCSNSRSFRAIAFLPVRAVAWLHWGNGRKPTICRPRPLRSATPCAIWRTPESSTDSPPTTA